MADPNCLPNIGPPPLIGASDYIDVQPPPIDTSNLVCLRGPCRYLWRMETRFDAMNNVPELLPDGVEVARIERRLCTYIVGDPDPDITEERIYECNQWDPVDPEALRLRNERRAKFSLPLLEG